MASVTFRKLRESNSLAYGCYSYYGTPDDPAGNHYFVTYLSTQADKLPDAMKAVESMGFPVDLAAIGNSRDTLLKSQPRNAGSTSDCFRWRTTTGSWGCR